MKATITKGWSLWYINGATAYEFQAWRVCVRFLKPHLWWWPRRHFLTGRIEFPRLIHFSWDGGELS